MWLLTHAGYPVTLHRSFEAAEATKMKLVEQTNFHPDDLVIRFLIVSDDIEEGEWN